MANEQFPKSALDKFRQWHFWWLVVFSFLLIITFVYYLPTMFLNQSMVPHDAPMGMPIDESQPHGHDSSGNSISAEQEDMANMMADEEMHEHMDEHMSDGMDMDVMMEHMMETHDMSKEEANQMMDEMMLARRSLGEGGGHEHEDGEAGHGHKEDEIVNDDNDGSGGNSSIGSGQLMEESDAKEGLVVSLNVNPAPYNVGMLLRLDFFVNEKPGNLPVLANQLQIEHEKLMHVIGVRSDMNEFFHIHPEFLADNSSIFSIEHTFQKPGLYKIWSSIKKDGTDYVYGHPEVNINGLGSRENKKVFFSRNAITGNYQVSLASSDTVVKGREIDLSFDIHTLNGQEINVEDYLGAQMHLVLIKDDWSQFIHTHPADGDHGHSRAPVLINEVLANGDDHSSESGGDEVISFAVTFPEAGLYKAFAQFQPQGIDLPADEALLAEFWIQVEEKAPFPVSQRWGLLVISALLTAGLSWWVKGYLKV